MSDSLFPFIDTDVDSYTAENNLDTELPTPKEYAWDFTNNNLILENGKPIIVTENEAIKVWIYKAFNTSRNKYQIYSEDYGIEIKSLIGQRLPGDVRDSEIKRILEECLLTNPYINSIENIVVTLDKRKLYVNITIITDFGDVNIQDVEVRIEDV